MYHFYIKIVFSLKTLLIVLMMFSGICLSRRFLFNDAEVKQFDPTGIATECFGGEMTVCTTRCNNISTLFHVLLMLTIPLVFLDKYLVFQIKILQFLHSWAINLLFYLFFFYFSVVLTCHFFFCVCLFSEQNVWFGDWKVHGLLFWKGIHTTFLYTFCMLVLKT